MSDDYPSTEAMKCAVEMEIELSLMTSTVAKGRAIDRYLNVVRKELVAANTRLAELENWKREGAELLMSLDRERSAANTRLGRQSAVIEAMDAFATAHEQWEADLILCNKAWTKKDGMPAMTQELWDRAMELQAKRNVARAAKAAMEGEDGG